MKYILHLGLVFLAVIVQLSLLPYLLGPYAGLNPIAIIVITLVFTGKRRAALLWLAAGGILLDLYSPIKFGVYIIELTIAFLLAGIFAKYFVSRINVFPIFIFVFVFFLIVNLVWLSSEIGRYFWPTIRIAALSALGNSLIASFTAWIFLKNEKNKHI